MKVETTIAYFTRGDFEHIGSTVPLNDPEKYAAALGKNGTAARLTTEDGDVFYSLSPCANCDSPHCRDTTGRCLL